jgi:hypothetical protein
MCPYCPFYWRSDQLQRHLDEKHPGWAKRAIAAILEGREINPPTRPSLRVVPRRKSED